MCTDPPSLSTTWRTWSSPVPPPPPFGAAPIPPPPPYTPHLWGRQMMPAIRLLRPKLKVAKPTCNEQKVEGRLKVNTKAKSQSGRRTTSPPRTARSLSCNRSRRSRSPSADLELIVGGQGARHLEVAKLRRGRRTPIRCAGGCELVVSTVDSIKNQARRGGDIRLEVASAVIKGQKTNFVMRPGYQDALLCPSCQRRRIEILLPELGSSSKGHRVARSSPTAVSSTAAAPDDECEPQTNRRFAFSAALWASENGGGIESAKYITDAIHVGYQLQSAMRLNPRVDAEVDRVLLAAGSGFLLLGRAFLCSNCCGRFGRSSTCKLMLPCLERSSPSSGTGTSRSTSLLPR